MLANELESNREGLLSFLSLWATKAAAKSLKKWLYAWRQPCHGKRPGNFHMSVVILIRWSCWHHRVLGTSWCMSSDSWETLGEVHVQAKEDKISHYLVKIKERMKDLKPLGMGSATVYWGNWDQFVLTRVWNAWTNGWAGHGSQKTIQAIQLYDFMLVNPSICTICHVKESAIHKDFNLPSHLLPHVGLILRKLDQGKYWL